MVWQLFVIIIHFSNGYSFKKFTNRVFGRLFQFKELPQGNSKIFYPTRVGREDKMKESQKKALSRVAKKIARKHRVRNWNDFGVHEDTLGKGSQIGNFVMFQFGCKSGVWTRREARRIKGMLPELMKRLQVTARACGFKENLFLDEWLASKIAEV